jgi:hypothetical protein
MPEENERKDVQKAMAYTASELKALIDAYISGARQ